MSNEQGPLIRRIDRTMRALSRSPNPLKRLLESIDFVAYAPYVTFSSSDNDRFLHKQATPIQIDNIDTHALMMIGREAFSLLTKKTTRELSIAIHLFRKRLPAMDKLAKDIRAAGGVLHPDGRPFITFPLRKGEVPRKGAVSHVGATTMSASDFTTMFSRAKQLSDEFQIFAAHLLIECLEKIDEALEAMQRDYHGAVASTAAATQAIEMAKAMYNSNESFAKALTDTASKGAKARHRADPKREDKKRVYQKYLVWRARPQMYPNKVEFARDMLEMKGIKLVSEKKITDWVRAWDRQKDGTLLAQ